MDFDTKLGAIDKQKQDYDRALLDHRIGNEKFIFLSDAHLFSTEVT
jgi:hypothetical protein